MHIYNFSDRLVKVKNEDGLFNFIDKEKNIRYLFPNMWFTLVEDLYNGFARVLRKDGKWNFINDKGNILSPNQWFEHVGTFYDGIAYVYDGRDGWNYINSQGNLLSPNQWFSWVCDFNLNYGIIQDKNAYMNFIDKEGNILSPNLWFDDAMFYKKQPIAIVNDKKYYFDINKKPHIFLL